MLKLTALTLEGFRSFAAEPPERNVPGLPGQGYATNRLDFGDATVLIGPNGAGKSTVTSFFRMLNFMTTGALQEYVGRQGGKNAILHYGSKRTPVMRANLEFDAPDRAAETKYEFRLASAANDALIFTDEITEYRLPQYEQPRRESLGAGHLESRLRESDEQDNQTSHVVLDVLSHCRFYHFHDTSEEAKIRQAGYIEDNRYLRSDAGNLAAFLYGLKRTADTEPYYRRIERTVQLVFPQLREFVLEPQKANDRYIMLNWVSGVDGGYLLGPHQISDGALRFMALATLFLQPAPPSLVVLDEPELGLHPSAIALLAELIKGFVADRQVLIATQSPIVVDDFDIAQIRPIEHRDGRSVVLRLDPDAYRDWLDEYSSGELWEKNVIGGGPTHG